ncbi:thioredoxin-dependent thiol peroxidase [Candidatus Odyssella acanthamoebae]|uniref:thioredoxin-dependent peroxiredoxin n=1 Tax=Candidatus Odyssella acanthamoebae TaxID=91604 RepID=A0A077AZG2_9PROT|nr:thioredoxin-dependent thiol peroxidase [Candidatus Paracaedibacter acanthamoebae]AIK96135.1 alkyl hydroperoxide reductase [Candidatus Paracaedibacter acanthamoebae]
MLAIRDQAPDFTLRSDTGETIALSALKGKKVVLYFYPKDNTSGCTKQACDIRDNLAEIKAKAAIVIGVSKDSLKSHAKFRENHQLNFPLLSDETGEICEKYGTWVEKSMYGRKYMGIDRATFIIDEQGKISHIWRKVKVPGHLVDVLGKL